jgi:hypothetical protein
MFIKNKHIGVSAIIRKRLAPAFMLYYSLFIVFAVFHHHEINFRTDSKTQIEETGSSEKVFDPFLDENSVCQLVQFSAAKISLNPDLDFSLPPLQKTEITQPGYSNHYFLKYYFNVDLRAPPSNS